MFPEIWFFENVCIMWVILSTMVASACEKGWFGEKCEFKCYCREFECQTDGECGQSDRCALGKFGPACQYIDSAYVYALPSTLKYLVDHNDSTCNPSINNHLITVILSKTVHFYWIRLTFKERTILGNIRDLKIKFDGNATCSDKKIYISGTNVIDVTCRTVLRSKLIVTGLLMQSLCSIYISGDNVQSPTSLSMSTYNRAGALIQRYDVTSPLDSYRFYVLDMSLIAAKSMTIVQTTKKSPQALTLCEVEVNGQTICPAGQYGFHCEKTCQCQSHACHVYTGVCFETCVNDHEVLACSQAAQMCPEGTYGNSCERECPEFCYNNTCKVRSGDCLDCRFGYVGPRCAGCSGPFYGDKCSYPCPANCDDTCHPFNGDCDECLTGFSGSKCEHISSGVAIITVVISATAVLAMVSSFVFISTSVAVPIGEGELTGSVSVS